MRSHAALFALFLAAPSAAAEHYAPIELSKLPERCRAVAEIPHSARSVDPVFSARISGASCLIDVALADIHVSDNDASIKAVNAATGPIIATLDEVISHGQLNWHLIALYVKSDLLFGLEARLRSSIPPITQATPLDAARDLERRHDALEPKLALWDAGARAAARQFASLVQTNPRVISDNPVLQNMARRVAFIGG